jgi:SAM-dependent methyltransferase
MPIINKKGYTFTGDRIEKAIQIECVLRNHMDDLIKEKKILDLGCGDGVIGEYFAQNNDVIVADIEDMRLNKNTNFIFVDDNGDLPFKDKEFDIVITNHVIEHILDDTLNSHQKHLEEIHRVMKDDGVCYFATPNKNYPIEPHHKIPLLHYFDPYTDITLISYGEMKKLFKQTSFHYTDYTIWVAQKIRGFDVPLWLSWILPSNIFILQKESK